MTLGELKMHLQTISDTGVTDDVPLYYLDEGRLRDFDLEFFGTHCDEKSKPSVSGHECLVTWYAKN